MAKRPQSLSGVRPGLEYDLPPPNDWLAYRGGLEGLTDPARHGPGPCQPGMFQGSSSHETWVDPTALSAACDADPRLRGAVSAALDGLKRGAPDDAVERALKNTYPHLDRVFEAVLTDTLARWEKAKPLVARYLLAREAARRRSPDLFPDPEE